MPLNTEHMSHCYLGSADSLWAEMVSSSSLSAAPLQRNVVSQNIVKIPTFNIHNPRPNVITTFRSFKRRAKSVTSSCYNILQKCLQEHCRLCSRYEVIKIVYAVILIRPKMIATSGVGKVFNIAGSQHNHGNFSAIYLWTLKVISLYDLYPILFWIVNIPVK